MTQMKMQSVYNVDTRQSHFAIPNILKYIKHV